MYEHFGEGSYEVTENNIRFLLGIDEINPVTMLTNEPSSFLLTPETYLGYERADKKLGTLLIQNEISAYHFSNHLVTNAWELEGKWQVFSDRIVSAEANSKFRIHFHARTVYLVMGIRGKNSIRANVILNVKGKNSVKNSVSVNNHTLYEVIQLKQMSSDIVEIITTEPGLEVYTVTFGA